MVFFFRFFCIRLIIFFGVLIFSLVIMVGFELELVICDRVMVGVFNFLKENKERGFLGWY